MAHLLQDTESSTLTGGSASSRVSTGATSLAASLFSSSISNSSVSMYQTSKQRSQSFAQCPAFPVLAGVRSGLGLLCRIYVHQDRITQEWVGVGEAHSGRSWDGSEYCQQAVRSGSRDIGLLVRDMERLVCHAVLIHPDCETEPGFQVHIQRPSICHSHEGH